MPDSNRHAGRWPATLRFAKGDRVVLSEIGREENSDLAYPESGGSVYGFGSDGYTVMVRWDGSNIVTHEHYDFIRLASVPLTSPGEASVGGPG